MIRSLTRGCCCSRDPVGQVCSIVDPLPEDLEEKKEIPITGRFLRPVTTSLGLAELREVRLDKLTGVKRIINCINYTIISQ